MIVTVHDHEQQKQDQLMAQQRYALSLVPEYREILKLPPLWSASQCQDILKALALAVETFGWQTTRHQAYPTMDIPCYQVWRVYPFIQTCLNEQVGLIVIFCIHVFVYSDIAIFTFLYIAIFRYSCIHIHAVIFTYSHIHIFIYIFTYPNIQIGLPPV